jgi:2-polyprenyl-3-methyl-5-hydroxy-6-metoxy-1,4-benzoquinol methylase
MKYTFLEVTSCNMCGADLSGHKILGRRLNTSNGKNPKSKIGIATTIMKCDNCRLIYANPQPIPESVQDHYGLPPEDYWTESYFQVDDNLFSENIKIINRLMPIQKGMKALDIGAGIGKYMILLERAGFEAYGLEASKPFHERAISKMGINPERLQCEMLETAKFPNAFFDFISINVVLEHLYDPSATIQKAMTWLKPNGILFIEIPSSDWLVPKIINTYYKLRGTDYVTNISPMHVPFHLFEFSLKSFELNAKKNNYEIAFHEFHVCPTYLPKIFDIPLKMYMEATKTGMIIDLYLRPN